MSTIKNCLNGACETLVSFSEKANSSSKETLSWAKEIQNEVHNDTVKLAEKYCLNNCLGAPDGNPIKGEDAIHLMKLFNEALNDSNFKFINDLKELGFIHK